MKKLLMLIPLLVSCNATMQKRGKPVFIPEWVKAVESGSQPVVRRTKETYFRSIFEGYGNSTQLCEKAIEHNLHNVKRLYPELGSKMPYEVKSVFYLPPNKCATTIALSHETINQSLTMRKHRLQAEADERERTRPRTDRELLLLAHQQMNKGNKYKYRENQRCGFVRTMKRQITCGFEYQKKGEKWFFMLTYTFNKGRTYVKWDGGGLTIPFSRIKKIFTKDIKRQMKEHNNS